MSEQAADLHRPDLWSSAATGYESGIAPIMRPFAAGALDLLGVTTPAVGTRLLDVAAGTGVLSTEAARRGAEVTATDFSPGMVDAMRRAFASSGPSARLEVMDGQRLELPDACFDVATSTFGVIFFSDPPAGLREMLRVLRPGGRAGVAAWATAQTGLQELIGATLARTVPDLPPLPTPPGAGLGAEGGLRRALEEAGFVDVQVHPVTHHWDPPPDPADFLRRLPEWTPPLRPLFAGLPPGTIDRAATVFADLVREHRAPDGVPQTALVGVGIKPA